MTCDNPGRSFQISGNEVQCATWVVLVRYIMSDFTNCEESLRLCRVAVKKQGQAALVRLLCFCIVYLETLFPLGFSPMRAAEEEMERITQA